MPKLEPDKSDPMELIGVVMPVPDDNAMQKMAECFVEEFVRLGNSAEEIMAIFRDPFYRGAHQAYQTVGETSIRDLIEKYVRMFRPTEINSSMRV